MSRTVFVVSLWLLTLCGSVMADIAETARKELKDVPGANRSLTATADNDAELLQQAQSQWRLSLGTQSLKANGHVGLLGKGLADYSSSPSSLGLAFRAERIHNLRQAWLHGPRFDLNYAQTDTRIIRQESTSLASLDIIHASLGWTLGRQIPQIYPGLSCETSIGIGPWTYLLSGKEQLNQSLDTIAALEIGIGLYQSWKELGVGLDHRWSAPLQNSSIGVDPSRWMVLLTYQADD